MSDGVDPYEPIAAERLALVLLPVEVLRAVVAAAGAEPPIDVAWPGVAPIPAELVPSLPAARRLAQVEVDPSVAPWLIRSLVVADPSAPTGRRVVGHLGGHEPPDAEGFVEVGYTVAEAERGRGLATEAARAWLAWAHHLGAARARVSTTADNAPSLALAARLGLQRVVDVWDDEDQVWELVFEGPLPLASP